MRALKLILFLFSFCVFLSNSFAQWSLQTSGVNSTLHSVHFVNNNLGFIAGENGVILKTIDGGNNWSISSAGTSLNFYGIRFTNVNYGWVVGDNGRIMITTNGGTNWVQQISGTTRTLESVFFINAETGWVVGDSVILKTINSGLNWNLQTTDNLKKFNSVYFINLNTGWITGNSTLKTTNGGINWIAVMSSTNGGNSIFFVNENTGWYVGRVYTLKKSTDGGETWNPGLINDEVNSPPAIYTCIYFINENTGWFTSSHTFGGRIMMTTDNGLSWNTDYPTTQNRQLNGVYAISSGIGWAVGYNGTILKRDALTGNINNGSRLPSSYSLYQNYPNPFNPVTKIKFDIAPLLNGVGSVYTTLKVFDLIGQEITTLVNENLQPGTYEYKFDGSNYTSGIYYYKLTAGNFVEIKKMLLIK